MSVALFLSGILLIPSISLAGSGQRPGSRGAGAREVQVQTAEKPFLQVGEELEYRVSYSFFHIGTIRFKVQDSEVRNGRPVFNVTAVMESNPSLSWLTEVHIRFYGEMDDSIFSWYWVSEDSSKSGIDFHTLTFRYDDSVVVYRKGKTGPSGEKSIQETDTVRIHGRAEDGLSLFYFARRNVRQKKEVVVPTVIDNKEEKTYINFQNKIEDVEIDAVDYPIETVFFDGKADFVGVAGLTGGFRGWFSNDDARIPIVARLSVWLGSIKVELIRWNRPGWVPPRFVERH